MNKKQIENLEELRVIALSIAKDTTVSSSTRVDALTTAMNIITQIVNMS